MLWRDALRKARMQLDAADVEDADREAVYLLQWATGRTFADWVLGGGSLAEAERAQYDAAVTRRAAREPLAYITGFREFFGLNLHVTPAVLIPRPETELMVEAALNALPDGPLRVVDVGTGSGAIALALKAHRPQWQVCGVDISAAALEVASGNGDRLGIPVEWRHSDLLRDVSEAFHAVIANLPYIAPDDASSLSPEVLQEPHGALFAEDRGLYLMERLVLEAPSRLVPGGCLVMECGAGQARALSQQVSANGFEKIEVLPDYAGIDRVVTARLSGSR